MIAPGSKLEVIRHVGDGQYLVLWEEGGTRCEGVIEFVNLAMFAKKQLDAKAKTCRNRMHAVLP